MEIQRTDRIVAMLISLILIFFLTIISYTAVAEMAQIICSHQRTSVEV